jgi:hypothetical protein
LCEESFLHGWYEVTRRCPAVAILPAGLGD